METLSLEDSSTLQAIGILADVLDKVSGPTVLDTVLVSKALRQVLATRSQPAFEFASRAFMTLDPEIRGRIAENAESAAADSVQLRGRVSGLLAERPPQPLPLQPTSVQNAPVAPAVRPAPASNHGSSLLNALNTRRTPVRPERKDG